jgi:hypothetical protein
MFSISGLNLGEAGAVDGHAKLDELLGKPLLRDGGLRIAARLLHAFSNKVLSDLAHRATRLPGPGLDLLF